MKKTVAVLMAAVLLLSCVACGMGYTKDDVVGTWSVTEAKGSEDVKNLIGSKMTFQSDGSYKWEYMGITIMQGSYKVSSRYLYLDDDGLQIKIDGKIMTMKDASGELTLIRKS